MKCLKNPLKNEIDYNFWIKIRYFFQPQNKKSFYSFEEFRLNPLMKKIHKMKNTQVIQCLRLPFIDYKYTKNIIISYTSIFLCLQNFISLIKNNRIGNARFSKLHYKNLKTLTITQW